LCTSSPGSIVNAAGTLGFGLVVIVAFIPPLVELIARHLR
jgi:hypothetical protein